MSASEKPRFCGKCKSSLWDRPRANPKIPRKHLLGRKSGAYQELQAEIERSKRILELQDDWDGEGSPGYSEKTFNRAVAFLTTYADGLWESCRMELPIPKIGPGPDGSIDLFWKQPHWELLVNIPTDPNEAASFSGEDDEGHQSRGFQDTEKFNPILGTWLKR